MFQIFSLFILRLDLRPKADSLFVHPLLDDILQAIKGPAHDKEYVSRVYGLLLPLACAAVPLNGLHL